jgi:hypothetical protein
MSADGFPYSSCPVCGNPLIPGTSRYTCETIGFCKHAARLAIERAAEVDRLRDQLKNMADFFEDYTGLTEAGQAKIESEADRLIASARKTLNEPKPKTKE